MRGKKKMDAKSSVEEIGVDLNENKDDDDDDDDDDEEEVKENIPKQKNKRRKGRNELGKFIKVKDGLKREKGDEKVGSESKGKVESDENDGEDKGKGKGNVDLDSDEKSDSGEADNKDDLMEMDVDHDGAGELGDKNVKDSNVNEHQQDDGEECVILTDLQKHILRMIKENDGKPVLIDDIVSEIRGLWHTLRKRDGSRYTYDCGRVVAATLANTSSTFPLFVKETVPNPKDPSVKDDFWKFGSRAFDLDLEGIAEEARQLLADAGLLKTPLKKGGAKPSTKSRKRTRASVQEEKLDKSKSKRKQASESKGKQQQAQQQQEKEAKTKQQQQEKASRSQPIVKKRRLNPHRTEPRRPQKDKSEKGSNVKQPEKEGLTTLQDMLMRILLSHGGVSTFDTILEAVNTKRWNQVHRWGFDCKRALLASLSHNPPGTFRKTKDGTWTISPKAISFAEDLVKQNPSSLSLAKYHSLPKGALLV